MIKKMNLKKTVGIVLVLLFVVSGVSAGIPASVQQVDYCFNTGERSIDFNAFDLVDSSEPVFKKVVLKGECVGIEHTNSVIRQFHIGSFWFYPGDGAICFKMFSDFELTVDGEPMHVEPPVRLYLYRFFGFAPTPNGFDSMDDKNITVIGYCEQVHPIPQKVQFDIHDEPLFNVTDIEDLGQAAYGLSSDDFNNDGYLDFAISWATDVWPQSLPDIVISIYYNNKDTTFSREDVYVHDWEEWGYVHDLESGDFDDDGDIDFLFSLDENIDQFKTNGTIYLLRNQGDNTFGEKEFITRHCSEAGDHYGRFNPQVTASDFDNDGDLDFLVGDNSGMVEFYTNNGDGTFAGKGVIHDFGYLSWGVTSGDFDNDGDSDFCVIAELEERSQYGTVYLVKNQYVESDGSVIFTDEAIELIIQIYSHMGTGYLTSMDYDGDGLLDLVAGIDYSIVLFLQRTDSWNRYLAGDLPWYPKDGHTYVDNIRFGGLTSGDFDGDDRQDLITGGVMAIPRMCLNNFDNMVPPLTPEIDGPQNDLVPGESYTYTVSSLSDVNDDTLSVLVDWGDGSDTGWLSPVETDDTVTVDHAWDDYGLYPVKVKVRDSDGLESNWGDYFGSVSLSYPFPVWTWLLSKILPSNDIMCSIEDSMNPVVNDSMSILNNPSLEVTLNEK